MAKLPENPRCPHCGSYDTKRHWGDQLMQAGAGFIGGVASAYILGEAAPVDTVAKGAESLVNGFSQKYTCNDCDRDFTLAESEIEDTASDESMDCDSSREDIVERAAFEMEIVDVFEIEGRGIVITGRVSTGCVYNGETISISGSTGPEYNAEVIGIEMFRKFLDRAEEGDNCGLLIRGVSKRDIHPGMVASHMLHIQTPSEETSCKPVQLTDAEMQYLNEFKACLEEGPEISASTRRLLNRLASSLDLNEEQVSRIEKMQ